MEIDHLEQAVLVELGLDQGQGEAAPIHRLVELLQHEGQRPLVILVAVRDDERQDVVAAPEQPSDIGDHEVDAEHLVARELDAAVEHHDLAAVLHGGHVLADLAETAERDDPEGVSHVGAILPARGRAGEPARRGGRTRSCPARHTQPPQLVGDDGGFLGGSGHQRGTTGTRPPTASTTVRNIAAFSSSVSVGESPVVPATTSPSEPLPMRYSASSASLPWSTVRSASKGVTIAVRIVPRLSIMAQLLGCERLPGTS